VIVDREEPAHQAYEVNELLTCVGSRHSKEGPRHWLETPTDI